MTHTELLVWRAEQGSTMFFFRCTLQQRDWQNGWDFTANSKVESPGTHLNACFKPDLPAVPSKAYRVHNSLVLMQKMSERTAAKGLFALVPIQAQVAQIHWSDVGRVLLRVGSLIPPLPLRVQPRCAQEMFLRSFSSRVSRSTSVLAIPWPP